MHALSSGEKLKRFQWLITLQMADNRCHSLYCLNHNCSSNLTPLWVSGAKDTVIAINFGHELTLQVRNLRELKIRMMAGRRRCWKQKARGRKQKKKGKTAEDERKKAKENRKKAASVEEECMRKRTSGGGTTRIRTTNKYTCTTSVMFVCSIKTKEI